MTDDVRLSDVTTLLDEPVFRCGSRDSSPLGDRNFPGPDKWRQHKNGDRVCSFCGSLHPEDFERLVKDAANPITETNVHRSDKTYKWYVDQAGVRNAMEGGIKFYTWHATEPGYVDTLNAILPEAVAQSSIKTESSVKRFQEDLDKKRIQPSQQ